MSPQTGVIDPANLTLRIPRQLASPNTWQGRHWRVKHRISQNWEKAIGDAMIRLAEERHGRRLSFGMIVAALSGPKWANSTIPNRRIRVCITREVPSGRNFIRDDDNLRFCVKPLLDALTRQGYIKNDSRKWIELPTPAQKISADRQYWTEITLHAI